MIMSTSWNPWHGCFLFSPNLYKLLKDGKLYRIKRYYQISQAWKAGINYRIGRDGKPEGVIK